MDGLSIGSQKLSQATTCVLARGRVLLVHSRSTTVGWMIILTVGWHGRRHFIILHIILPMRCTLLFVFSMMKHQSAQAIAAMRYVLKVLAVAVSNHT